LILASHIIDEAQPGFGPETAWKLHVATRNDWFQRAQQAKAGRKRLRIQAITFVDERSSFID